jgi:hypothetical protein
MRSTFRGRVRTELPSMLHFSRQLTIIPFSQIIPVPHQLCNVTQVWASEHKCERLKDLRNVRKWYFPTGRRSHPYLVRARLAMRKASLLIPPLTPPNPHADAKGASLFVPDSSRAFLSCPRTMHDEIRTGPPYGDALSTPHCREAHIKTILSFQNLKAALPPGIPAGRRSNSP